MRGKGEGKIGEREEDWEEGYGAGDELLQEHRGC